MLITNLKAGLGNQMFQYAFGRKLSIANKIELKLDKTSYDRDKFRTYGLSMFKVEENFASFNQVKKLKYPYGVFSKIWRLFKAKAFRDYHSGWEPKTVDKVNRLLAQNKDVYLDGYWQSYKYFQDIKDVLVKDFSLKVSLEQTHPELMTKINLTESVAISVRRTDYLSPVNLKNIGVCSADYYKKAIDLITSKIKDPTFFVITDDLEWTKANIITNCPTVWVSELRKDGSLNHIQEMMIMSKCKHGIIANSTFSWWPTWLNDNPGQIIIAPDIWANNYRIKIDDIIPPTWIKLPRD